MQHTSILPMKIKRFHLVVIIFTLNGDQSFFFFFPIWAVNVTGNFCINNEYLGYKCFSSVVTSNAQKEFAAYDYDTKHVQSVI